MASFPSIMISATRTPAAHCAAAVPCRGLPEPRRRRARGARRQGARHRLPSDHAGWFGDAGAGVLPGALRGRSLAAWSTTGRWHVSMHGAHRQPFSPKCAGLRHDPDLRPARRAFHRGRCRGGRRRDQAGLPGRGDRSQRLARHGVAGAAGRGRDTAEGRIGYGPVCSRPTSQHWSRLVSSRVVTHRAAVIGRPDEHPFITRQTRITFKRNGITDPVSLDDYKATGRPPKGLDPRALHDAGRDRG